MKRPRTDPLDGLIATILSQNTTDRNSDRAFRKLRKTFPTWKQACAAGPDAIKRAIRSGGLARIKSRRIQQVLRTIREREGALTLQRLRTMPTEEALAYLTGLDGVGIKTACCVLLFSCGRPVMPVDTHVYRVSRRLGILAENTPIQKAHEELHRRIAPVRRYAMHLLLIRHGRQTCRARKPECNGCALKFRCPSAGIMTK
ncbi:MAG: endonuclease III [Verrucomicrobia bacterium]|nr:endonuclease III [Verrucomicrobiota bacterium]